MVDVMRDKFQQQLQQLNEDLIEMGALCKEAVADAILINRPDRKHF